MKLASVLELTIALVSVVTIYVESVVVCADAIHAASVRLDRASAERFSLQTAARARASELFTAEPTDTDSRFTRSLGSEERRGIETMVSDSSTGISPLWSSYGTRIMRSSGSGGGHRMFSMYARFNLIADELDAFQATIMNEPTESSLDRDGGLGGFFPAARAAARAARGGVSSLDVVTGQLSAYFDRYPALTLLVARSAGVNVNFAGESLLSFELSEANAGIVDANAAAERLIAARNTSAVGPTALRMLVMKIVPAFLPRYSSRVQSVLNRIGTSTDVWEITARSGSASLIWHVVRVVSPGGGGRFRVLDERFIPSRRTGLK